MFRVCFVSEWVCVCVCVCVLFDCSAFANWFACVRLFFVHFHFGFFVRFRARPFLVIIAVPPHFLGASRVSTEAILDVFINSNNIFFPMKKKE